MEFLSALNWYDWLVVAVLLYGGWSGLRSGLSGELIMTTGLLLMVGLAILLYLPLGNWLAERTSMDIDLAHLIAFVGIAVVVYLVAFSVRQVTHRKMKKGLFSTIVENIGGVAAGVVRWALVAACLTIGLCLLPNDFWQEQVGTRSRFGAMMVGYLPAVKETVEKQFGERVWFLGEVKRRPEATVPTDESSR